MDALNAPALTGSSAILRKVRTRLVEEAWARMVVRGSAVLLIVMGAIVMIGWWMRSEAIVQISPDFTPMQFNTALCFSLSGLGLLALNLRRVWLVRACGILAGAIATLTQIQYLTGLSFGIDTLFAHPFTTVETSHPGRMAPNTAFAFMLSATFLLLSVSTWKRRLAMSLLLIVSPAIAGLAVLSLVGYAAGIEALFGWSQYTRMALHTSVGFLILGIGTMIKAWRLEAWRGLDRSFSVIAPAVVASLTVMTGLWLALSHYERQRLEALQAVAPDLAERSALPEIVLAVGLLLTALIGVAVHFVHAARQTEDLRRSNAELRQANAELDKFAYVASHDLKAPLRGIHQLATWIRSDVGDATDERTQRYLNQLDTRVTRLQDLLEGLLSYSRVGRSDRRPTQFSLREALDGVVALLSLPEGMRVDIRAGGGQLEGDRALFETVFMNLVANAAKHHDRETGVICITVRPVKSVYEIEVADDGPGIAPQYHARIFEIFQTLRPRDELEASGMGLAIVRKALDRAGGRIRVVSDPAAGRGTRFIVDWPRVPERREMS
jgi:signal transduction histidine kinase